MPQVNFSQLPESDRKIIDNKINADILNKVKKKVTLEYIQGLYPNVTHESLSFHYERLYTQKRVNPTSVKD